MPLGSLITTAILAAFLIVQDAPVSKDVVFREPFLLKLVVDKEHYYEEKYDRKIPYVHKNDVYLFVNEEFGINIEVKEGKIAEIKYQPDPKKADVLFRFSQPDAAKREPMMMLVIESRVDRRLYMDALMTVPGRKGIYPTTILPLEPRLKNFESWPHSIAQLVIRNISFERPTTKKN